MATTSVLILSACFLTISASFFDIQYPNVYITAEKGGNLTIQAGPQQGNIFMKPNGNGTVYIGHTDMLKLFEIVNSLPPTWKVNSAHGSLGVFAGGQSVNLLLEAIDPEGGKMRFEKVSGAFPPGVHLDKTTGRLTGNAPDVDATYEFGIRVTDAHGKYADQIFSIDTREKNQCNSNPCQHNGKCEDAIDDYKCNCTNPYGGSSCQFDCRSKAVGVDNGVKTIPDAQLSSHYASGDHPASDGRLNNPRGWSGTNTGSWLQVDIGHPTSVYAVATQGQSSSSYIKTFRVQYSVDGNTFTNVVNGTSTMEFTGSSSVNSVVKHPFPQPVTARYIRFIPRTYQSKPGMRVEVYGCEIVN
ncbi:lactadherin-like [Mytilus galloprovincialis]|uniref:lactadherin-like n=1 Tax=Mytilus galloprovincialis TaxID=29158 RepID=UPI003F7C6109